ncbi:TRAP-type C4-dicarboxylate transport system permease small subunit [Amorphus suaedae]
MKKFEQRVADVARGLALIGFFGLLVLASMTTLDVLLRWLFNAPLQGVNDVSSVVMAVVIAACIPANLAMKQNITVEVIGTMGGPGLQRAFDVVASTLTMIFIALIAWQFVPFASGLRETGERTWVLAWPVWPWWAVTSLMMVLAAIVQALVLVTDVVTLFAGDRGEAAKAPHAHGPDPLL